MNSLSVRSLITSNPKPEDTGHSFYSIMPWTIRLHRYRSLIRIGADISIIGIGLIDNGMTLRNSYLYVDCKTTILGLHWEYASTICLTQRYTHTTCSCLCVYSYVYEATHDTEKDHRTLSTRRKEDPSIGARLPHSSLYYSSLNATTLLVAGATRRQFVNACHVTTMLSR